MADFAWIEAMQEELHQFDRLQVWELVDKPFGKKVINLKWLWKNKKDKDQTVIRNKARLVAKGDGENLDKMKENEDSCILVGYSTQLKGYRVYNKRTRMIVESIHIRFDEIKEVSETSVANNTSERCQPTMEEYMTKTQEDYGSGIARPKIDEKEGDETLFQAWERYNDLLYNCPTHDINSHQKVNIFYNGLGSQTCGGPHLDKECPLNEEVKSIEEVKYGEFRRSSPFNNRAKYHVGPPGYYTRVDNRPPFREKRPNLEELLNKHLEESTQRRAEMEEWADLGASLKVMPKSMFEHLKLANLMKTNMLVEIDDMAKRAPIGIVENILVKIDKFLFLLDFVVIDMLNTRDETMILGRPFLATIHTEIDVFNTEISLGIRDDKSPKEFVASNDMVHNYYQEEAKKKAQLQKDKALNTKPSVQQSARLPNTANGNKSKPRNFNQQPRNWPPSMSSHVSNRSVNTTELPRNQKPFLQLKDLECHICKQCIFSENHDECILKYISELNSRASAQKKHAQSHKTTKRYISVEKKSDSKNHGRQIPIGQRFSPNKSSNVYLKITPPRSGLTWKPTGRIVTQIKKEKEGLDSKLTGFESASKDLDTLIGSQRSDNNKEGLRYSVVSPPSAQVYSPTKKDINPSVFEHGESSKSIMSKPMIKFVKAADRPTDIKTNKVEATRKPSIKYAEMYRNTHKSPKDSGCSWHITGNISYLSDYEPYDGGYVSFGQGGGKTTVNVSSNCVLFTDSECIVLGRDFKLKDDTNVLLRTPRQHNMYSIDLNNIFPHKDLTCLVVKASIDESMLWHRMLGHLNFKTMNKLVRHNLVKGLPSKCFENDHTCVACLKGKQHKAEAVNTACYVLTRVLVNKSQNKTLYELFKSRTPAIGFLKPFGCHVMILNTLDHLGKFDAKGDEGYFIGYFMSSKSFRVFNKRTKRVKENLHVDFLENKLIEKGAGPNWLFDIDTLTNSMNYVPVVVAETSSTNILGTKDVASQDVKKDVSSLRYIALPNWFHEAHLESATSNAQDACNADAPESSGNSNLTATSKNPPADQIETLTVESAIPTVSLSIPTACLETSLETISGSRLISKRVTSQDKTPSLDNISTLSNRFEDILGVTTNTCDTNGMKSDLGNILDNISASPTPTFRIHKDHPKSQIISLVDTPVQTRHKSKEMEEQSFIATIHQKINPDLLQFCLFSCFLSQEEPKKISNALKDPSWDLEFPDRVYKVEKAMYGLHQAPRAWYEGTKEISYLFKCILMILSLDHQNSQLCREFEALMHDKFQMSAMGELNFFLGLQVLQKKDGIFLSQDKYIGDILKKFGYSNVRSANTPMDKENPWRKDGPGKDVELHLYRSMIGSLRYLTASRPDIMFPVCACARQQVTPKECRLHAVK
nr:hypothetical protein [Tanacetum cinerariifolium]